jgi:hypothetical protein
LTFGDGGRWAKFIHPFIHSFVHSFIHSFIHSFSDGGDLPTGRDPHQDAHAMAVLDSGEVPSVQSQEVRQQGEEPIDTPTAPAALHAGGTSVSRDVRCGVSKGVDDGHRLPALRAAIPEKAVTSLRIVCLKFVLSIQFLVCFYSYKSQFFPHSYENVQEKECQASSVLNFDFYNNNEI